MATAPNLTPTEVIDRVRAARKAQQQAAVEELELALEWARLHPCPANETPAHWGEADLHDEGLVPLAGPGAPWVAEFAPVDLAAALGITHDAGRQLIADALELAHRLPRLWKRVLAGEVPVWRARLIARETTDLSVKAALFADRLIAATPRGSVRSRQPSWCRKRGCTSTPTAPSPTKRKPSPSAVSGCATARRPSDHRHHDDPGHPRRAAVRPDRHPHRRATSASSATPTNSTSAAHAPSGSSPTPSSPSTSLRTRDAAPSRGAVRVPPTSTSTSPPQTWQQTSRTARVLPRSRSSARHHRAAHRLAHPVRSSRHQDHPATGPRPQRRPRPWTSTTHPTRCAKPWSLRDAHCVFPGCHRDSRACDLDHITEYLPMEDGGPPGQTRPGNLAPLCRTHHRVKTHTAWHYKRLDDGSYEWTAPTGHQYRVTPASRRTAPGLV